MSCCRGAAAFAETGRSAYRNRQFRDAALLFGANKRFHADPFDKQRRWLQDLEDCQVRFEARAMLELLAAGVRKKLLRLNRASEPDLLVALAEFCRRLLFDEEGAGAAADLLRLAVLVLEAQGLGAYAQLFSPQEAVALGAVTREVN